MEEQNIISNAEIEKEIKTLGDSKEIFSEAFPILVVDDDAWIQRILSHYLQSWGFKTYSAMDAYEGMAMAIKYRPLLILLDIIMPEITGDLLLKMLKRVELTANIPILIISSNLNKDILGITYKEGAVGFVTKPFTQNVLFEKIRESLGPTIFSKMKSEVTAFLEEKTARPEYAE